MAPRVCGVSLAAFLLASSIFNLGQFVFFLLYNLYLLDLGFEETFLGKAAALMTAGSLCGTLPAGWVASRFGLAASLRIAFLAGSAVGACRAWATGRTDLLALAFLAGLASALWAVSVPPAITQLTKEENRPRAFSLFFALGIGMGILGGLLGGRLPGWISRWRPAALEAKRAALWIGCAFSALALGPALGLRFSPGVSSGSRSRIYPWTPFLRRYLAAAAAWNLFAGAFPPFFNAYLERRFTAGPVEIGRAFAAAQGAQAAGVLLAPSIFARLGLERAVAGTQAAAAILLGLVGAPFGATLPAAATLYAASQAWQWMSEPGWYSLLMSRISPEERSGASALYTGVIYGAQALAAFLFGAAAARLGYPASLAAASLLGLFSASLFYRLLGHN